MGTGRRPARRCLVAWVILLVTAATIAAPAGAVTTVVGFEEFDDGTALTTQYGARGVEFQPQPDAAAGAVVVACGAGEGVCDAALEGQNAAITPEEEGAEPTAFGFPREPLVAEFAEPQAAVSLAVQDAGDLQGSQIATLIARNATGAIVAQQEIRFEIESGWHRIGVSTDAAEIVEVTLTLAAEGTPDDPHNLMAVDDLQFQHNEPPDAAFDVRPEAAAVGEEITFDATASSDVDGEIVAYRWDFNGDGDVDRVAQSETVVAAFQRPGQYTATLTVEDDDGATDRVTGSFTVAGPVARCSVSDTDVDPGDTVVLDASASNADLVRFDTDGDGDFDRTAVDGFRASVTFDEAGTVQPVVRAEIGDQVDTVRCPPIDVSESRTGGLAGADVIAGGTGGLFGLFVLRKTYSKLVDDDDGDNDPPTAAIVLVPDRPDPGQPVFIDGSSSSDPDADDHVTTYRWAVDGREVARPRFVHTFLEEGDHVIDLEVADTHGASDTVEETVTVESTAGELAIDEAHPDAPGNDHENLVEEYLVFRNEGDEGLGLGGWTVHDTAEAEGRVTPGEHTFTFPEEFELDPDERVTVHTGTEPTDAGSGEGPAGEYDLYWDSARAIWNNDEDAIVVENDEGHPVLAVRYRRTEPETYEFEDLDVTVLEGWFGRVKVTTRDEGWSVAVTPAGGLGLKFVSALAGILMGATLLKGPMRFLRSWANLTGFVFSAAVTWATTTVTGLLPPSFEPIIPLLLVVGSVAMTVLGGIGVGVHFVVTEIWEWITGIMD